MCYYCKYPAPGINFNAGFTIKFKAQVVSSSGTLPFVFIVADGVRGYSYGLYLRDSAIYHELTKICDFDTTDAYHVYRVVTSGATATLYIDDVNKGSWTVSSGVSNDNLIFGDPNTSSSINIKIDYIYHGYGDLDVPDAAASAIKHYDYAALDDDGDAIESKFETGDFVLDEVEHLIRNMRFYGLGLDLKGYSTSSRLTLEFSVDEGVTWDELDVTEKSLTAAYALYNWDFLQTVRKIRFRFTDDTTSQKWYLRFYGIKQKDGGRV